ncbi:BON domain-containing protein [Mucilaginibacter lappiensis]|uniref:Osmotically-inducible protein OsmY n=1 Tax=Mucilaginibacter lappiensis TaxID=354630 RepID=A0A841JIB6_9SPHI|nr:BON domain-containing protein [Mucilaginibacter lappiensis]MBB6130687.1 osmotically-inducible protein OsmY [Mucilaginibacter lappiensis]
MKNNQELAKDVAAAIKWEPIMSGTDIHVTAIDGVVTLTGFVDGNLKKYKAEDVAKSIVGVKAVVEHIQLKFANDDEKGDDAIALEIIKALKADVQVPHDRIKIRVENGWVTLEGELPWNFEKQAAAAAIRPIEGIKVFTNSIRIQPDSPDEIEQEAIQRALRRSSAMDDQDIHVYVTENNVTLNGVVNSYFQKDEAERITWNAPGVRTVKNELSIDLKN